MNHSGSSDESSSSSSSLFEIYSMLISPFVILVSFALAESAIRRIAPIPASATLCPLFISSNHFISSSSLSIFLLCFLANRSYLFIRTRIPTIRISNRSCRQSAALFKAPHSAIASYFSHHEILSPFLRLHSLSTLLSFPRYFDTSVNPNCFASSGFCSIFSISLHVCTLRAVSNATPPISSKALLFS